MEKLEWLVWNAVFGRYYYITLHLCESPFLYLFTSKSVYVY